MNHSISRLSVYLLLYIAIGTGVCFAQQQNLPRPTPANANQQEAPQQGAQPQQEGDSQQEAEAEAAQTGRGRGPNLDATIPGTVAARNNDLTQILQFVGQQAGVEIITDSGINQKVTFSLERPTLREVLETVLPSNGLDYMVLESGVIRVGDAQTIAQEKAVPVDLMRYTFRPVYKNIEEVQAAFENLLSSDGRLITDYDTGQLIVEDIPEVIEDMRQMLQRLDVETQTRVFRIRYANAQEIADQLMGVVNTVEGELFIDYRNNQIIITDTPERLDRAQAIIEQLDRAIEPAIIPLSFALPEDVLPLIEGFLTEYGYLDFDPRTNRIIIWDIPSVVEQAVQLIKQIDIPTQQIWIEADIVQINNDKSFSLGTSADFGSDIGEGGNPAAPNTGSATTFFSFNPFLSTSGSGLTLLDVREGNYRLQVEAMVEKKVAEIIASPRLLVQDGGIGSFVLGSQEPFATRQQGYYGSGYSSGDYFTQQFRDVGTKIDLEVYSSESGYIEMFIGMEDTRSRRVQLSNLGEGLAVDGSFINTQATVKSGRTVVLGGIINRTMNKSHSGVPILSSIPVVGNLFKNRSDSSSKQKLLVFITPRIVNIDDPYEFAMVDNVERVRELQERGATGFAETQVDDALLDWSDEEEHEREAIERALERLEDEGVSANATSHNMQPGMMESKSLRERVNNSGRSSNSNQTNRRTNQEEGVIRTYSNDDSF